MQSTEDLSYLREFLTALAQFSKLSSLRLMGHFYELGPCTVAPQWYEGPWTKIRFQPHIVTDTITIHRIFSYLHRHKVGEKLKTLEVVFGNSPRKPRSSLSFLNEPYDRPIVLFTCKIGDEGEVIVENDCTEDDLQNPVFKYYFDNASLSDSVQGHLYLEELVELDEASDEADRGIAGSLEDDANEGDPDSLFGDSSTAMVLYRGE